MAHERRRISMYEVMSKGQLKAGLNKTLKKQRPEKTEIEVKIPAEKPLPVPGKTAYWRRKPKLVQFNAGRVEISLPYPIAIAVLLGIILLFVVALWLGEVGYFSRGGVSPGSVLKNPVGTTVEGPTGRREGTDIEEGIRTDTTITETDKTAGKNRIVIQTYDKRADLELVQYHFAEGGIETEIRKIGDRFYLITVNKYDNHGKAGTDGYAAREQIIKLGAQYKAPQGYETFAPKLFKDAYGMKFDD